MHQWGTPNQVIRTYKNSISKSIIIKITHIDKSNELVIIKGGGCGFGVLLFDLNTKTQCGSTSIILKLKLS